jgi:Ser/Thr protein kinase RdoA (MazF antagonist)
MSGGPMQSDLASSLWFESISEQYRVQVNSLQRLSSDSGKHIYRVKLANGASWILRMVKDPGKTTLVELAHLLIFFEQENYPAERIVLTVERAAIGTIGDRHICMTTFLVGSPLEYTPATLSLLGAMVGRLHALKLSSLYSPPQAGMLPSGELAFAQQRLAVIAPLVPRQYSEQYELLEKALSSIGYGTGLPTTLIHNDCHPANALVTAPGQVTLLDWEEAGMGPAILDIGFLLANCDEKVPWSPLPAAAFHPDEDRLKAVIEGYCRYHQPTIGELDFLTDAVRFRSLVFGACSFAAAIAQHERAEFSQWWWIRYCAAEEIAEKARMYFAQIL